MSKRKSKGRTSARDAKTIDLSDVAQAAALWAAFDLGTRAEIELGIAAISFVAELQTALVAGLDALKRGKSPSVTIDKGRGRLLRAACKFVESSKSKSKKATK